MGAIFTTLFLTGALSACASLAGLAEGVQCDLQPVDPKVTYTTSQVSEGCVAHVPNATVGVHILFLEFSKVSAQWQRVQKTAMGLWDEGSLPCGCPWSSGLRPHQGPCQEGDMGSSQGPSGAAFPGQASGCPHKTQVGRAGFGQQWREEPGKLLLGYFQWRGAHCFSVDMTRL